MSQLCVIKTCKRASRALCHCCNQNLCRDHFNEHDDLLNSQLNPLTDEINTLGDRLTAINLDKITNNACEKLNQWRINCHKIIDRFYEEKCQELDWHVTEHIDKQRKEIADVRSKMTQLIEKQETTKNDIDSLTSAIYHLGQKMNEIENIHVQVDIHPLILDNHLIQIGKSKMYQFDLLNLPPPYRTINRSLSSYNPLASNGRFVLAHIDSNLCLIDENLSVTKKKEWNDDYIEDMCWSSVLERFFVITKMHILLVDENRMSIEQVQQTETESIRACECSDKSLYLSRSVWDSTVFEFSLLPSIRFVKRWKTNDKLKQDQRIEAIVYSQGTLCLGINDQFIKAKLIELRSVDTFSTLWSIQLNVHYNVSILRCCRFNRNEWLLADWTTSCLFHITSNGKLKETCTYTSMPYNMACFGSNILAILTDGSVNFHRL